MPGRCRATRAAPALKNGGIGHPAVIHTRYVFPTQHEEFIMDQQSPPHPVVLGQLQAEISRLETRVQQLDEGRDSAYEKALIRSYEALLDDHRTRLATLRLA